MSKIANTFGGQDYYYTKDPTSLTKFLKTMLWISFGITVVPLLLSDLMEMNLLSRFGQFWRVAAESNYILVLYSAVLIVTGITFLRWIYRANSNCHGFDAQGMKFTPGWSIGWYFIPIAGFWKPFQSMKEIWKVSKNPCDWQNEKASPLLGWWWALFLMFAIFGGKASSTMAMDPGKIRISSSLEDLTFVLIILIIDVAFYIVAVSLVSAVYARQEKLVRKHV